MKIRFTLAFLCLIFAISTNSINAQKVNDNSTFKIPPSILKTFEKNLNNCLSSDEVCNALQSISVLNTDELNYYFDDFSENASSNYAQLISFGDNVESTIESYRNKIDRLSIEQVTYRYGHSDKVRLADMDIYFYKKGQANIVKATFLISKENQIYSVMLSN